MDQQKQAAPLRTQLLNTFGNIPTQMCWASSAINQLESMSTVFTELQTELGAQIAIVGKHTSKSIDLPVVELSTPIGKFTLRDNFYDVNLMAVLHTPASLSLAEFFAGVQEPCSWDWYLEEMEKARSYSWGRWTDKELRNPQILRVRDPRINRWCEKSGVVKDRWMARMTSPEWYEHDWSGAALTWDGVFGPGVKLYRQSYAYGEGIPAKTTNHVYARGCRDFIIAVGTLGQAVLLIKRLHGLALP